MLNILKYISCSRRAYFCFRFIGTNCIHTKNSQNQCLRNKYIWQHDFSSPVTKINLKAAVVFIKFTPVSVVLKHQKENIIQKFKSLFSLFYAPFYFHIIRQLKELTHYTSTLERMSLMLNYCWAVLLYSASAVGKLKFTEILCKTYQFNLPF